MWCQLLESIPDGDEALLVRDKIARRLLGYTFIQEIIDSPAFPAGSVEPEIRELIGRMAQITQASGGLADGHCTLFDALQFREGGAW